MRGARAGPGLERSEELDSLSRGEELTISYGEEWWSARDEEPI